MTDQEVIEVLELMELKTRRLLKRYSESQYALKTYDCCRLELDRKLTALTRAIQIMEEKII